jgi:hypothetical protein
MIEWIKHFLFEESAFLKVARRFPAGLRFLIAFLGWCMDQGYIPTGIPGGGQKYGSLIMVLALLVRAGEFNKQYAPKEPKE